jgi:hypothetical protein
MPEIEAFADGRTAQTAAEAFEILGHRFQRGRWAFRGHSDARWELRPSLERMAAPGDQLQCAENYVRTEFQRRAHHYHIELPARENTLEWLALMQHHGAPTRLLDWTESAYVAAFFSTVTLPPPGQSAAIWAIDLDALNDRAVEMIEPFYPTNHSPAFFCDVRTCSYWPTFDTVFMNPHPAAPGVIVPVKPYRMNERLTIQQGIFLCPSTLRMGFQAILNHMLQSPNESGVVKKEWLLKLQILPSARLEMLRELRKMNISYTTLFPGLDGFGASLNTEVQIYLDTPSS